ncbi:MAG: hypothetical protein AB1649_25650 [Chloroflexota bacterium]
MMNIDFGEVLRRTWKIGWNHKVLWLYQMLPGLFSLLAMPLFFLGNPAFAPLLPEPFNQALPVEQFLVIHLVATAILLLPIMFLAVLVQGATTFGALEADKGVAKLGFQETIKQSLPYFWRLFGLYALFGTIWAVVILVFMVVTIGVSFIPFAALCTMPMFLLIFPLALVGYSIMELAQSAIIVDNLTMQEAISRAWQMFRANVLGIVLLMLMLYFAMSILSSLIVFPLMIPMMFLPVAFENSADIRTPFLLVFFVFFPIMIIVMTVVQGILMALFQSAWLVAYRQLGRGQVTPVLTETNA